MPEYDEPPTEKKRGRQRTVLQAKNQVLLYRYKYAEWPSDLSIDMRSYYNIHYVRKDGDKHDIYVQYIREYQSEISANFGKEAETEISSPEYSDKVVRFPTR